MSTAARSVAESRAIPESDAGHFVWCVAGIGVGAVWTLLGWLLAKLQHEAGSFVGEWKDLQGFFLVTLGVWILLIVRSGIVQARISDLRRDGTALLGPLANRPIRLGIVWSVAVIGTTSLISMGFPSHGLLKVFMWFTAGWVCLTAGTATLHTIDGVALLYYLGTADIKVNRYAPARTPELRRVVSYYSSFSLLVTAGYAFALAGTLAGHWTGSPGYIETVRIFWPIIYVPTCTLAMLYPHLTVHQLIQREKEKTLASCQQDMDQLLARFQDLKTEDINRTNTLAQLFDRVVNTPNYVVDFGIVSRTLLPLALNAVSFFAKTAFTHFQGHVV